MVLVLAGTVSWSSGCGQDFLIGVLDAEGSSAGTVAAETTATVGPDASTVDPDTTLGTGSGTSGSSSSGTDGSSAGECLPLADVPLEACQAPPGHSVCDALDGDVFQAIGLDCVGGPQDTQPLVGSQQSWLDASSARVIREYGNPTWTATEGSYLLALTTGSLPTPDGSGYVSVPMGQTDAPLGNNGNPDGVALPVPTAPGSMNGAGGQPFACCDGVGDCSDSLHPPWQAGGPAHDLLWASFDIEVPLGTLGYQVDLAWFSAEYPARAAEPGTDVAVWWQSSEAFTGNVATLDGAALSAGSAAAWLAEHGRLGLDPTLVGTGYEGTTGAPCDHPGGTYPDCPRGVGTGWLTLTAPSQPGETLSVVVVLFDLLDADRDTTLLVDDWHWYCPGCAPGVDCGLAP